MKEDVNKVVGQRIKQRRKELRMSQDELAKKIGYKTKGAISYFENGLRSPDFEVVQKIAEALNTDLKYFWVEQEPKKLNPKTEHWSNLYNNLSDELKAQADYMLNMTEAMFFNQEIKEEDMEEVKRSIMEAFYKARGL